MPYRSIFDNNQSLPNVFNGQQGNAQPGAVEQRGQAQATGRSGAGSAFASILNHTRNWGPQMPQGGPPAAAPAPEPRRTGDGAVSWSEALKGALESFAMGGAMPGSKPTASAPSTPDRVNPSGATQFAGSADDMMRQLFEILSGSARGYAPSTPDRTNPGGYTSFPGDGIGRALPVGGMGPGYSNPGAGPGDTFTSTIGGPYPIGWLDGDRNPGAGGYGGKPTGIGQPPRYPDARPVPSTPQFGGYDENGQPIYSWTESTQANQSQPKPMFSSAAMARSDRDQNGDKGVEGDTGRDIDPITGGEVERPPKKTGGGGLTDRPITETPGHWGLNPDKNKDTDPWKDPSKGPVTDKGPFKGKGPIKGKGDDPWKDPGKDLTPIKGKDPDKNPVDDGKKPVDGDPTGGGGGGGGELPPITTSQPPKKGPETGVTDPNLTDKKGTDDDDPLDAFKRAIREQAERGMLQQERSLRARAALNRSSKTGAFDSALATAGADAQGALEEKIAGLEYGAHEAELERNLKEKLAKMSSEDQRYGIDKQVAIAEIQASAQRYAAQVQAEAMRAGANAQAAAAAANAAAQRYAADMQYKLGIAQVDVDRERTYVTANNNDMSFILDAIRAIMGGSGSNYIGKNPLPTGNINVRR